MDVWYLWMFCGRTFCRGGRFVEEDVLYRRTFCIGGRFVEGCFVEGCYVEGLYVGRTFCSEGRFVEGRFVLAPYILYNTSVIYAEKDRHIFTLQE
jgi:hypothetical protein